MNALWSQIQSSIKLKMVAYIVAPVLLIVMLSMVIVITVFLQRSEAQQRESRFAEFEMTAQRLELLLTGLQAVPARTAAALSRGPIDEEEILYSLVESNVEGSDLIYGSGVAFTQGGFSGKPGLFSPYAYRGESGIETTDIGSVTSARGYDYANGEFEWFEAARRTQSGLWTSPFFDARAGNVLMATYSVPFYSQSTFQGVATIDLALPAVFPELNLRSASEYIVSSTGRFIYHPDVSQILQSDIFSLDDRYSSEAIQSLLDTRGFQTSGILDLSTRSDEEVWALYYHLPQVGWSYFSLLPKSVAMADVNQQWLVVSFLAAVIVGLLFLLTWKMSGVITGPVSLLHGVAVRAAQGEYPDAIAIPGRDEISKLAAMLNTMFLAVSQNNDELERKVNSRTKDLKALRNESQRQRKIIESTLNGIVTGIIMYDRELKLLASNRRFFQLCGLEIDDWRDKSVLEISKEIFTQRLRQEWDDDTAAKRLVTDEEFSELIEFPEGQIVEIKHAPMPGSEGFIRTFDDVTERKTRSAQIQKRVDELADARMASLNMMRDAEEAREMWRVEGEMLDAALRGGNLGLWSYDVAEDDLEFSDLLDIQLGYEVGGIHKRYGHSANMWLELLHPDDKEKTVAAFQSILQGKSDEFRAEYRAKTKQGDWKWLMAAGQRLKEDENGVAIRLVGIQEDISEHKLLEESIRNEQERLQLALSGGQFGTWDTDLQTSQYIIDDRWANMLGYNRLEIEENFEAWTELIHRDDVDNVLGNFDSYIAGELPAYEVVYRAKSKSGEWLWIHSRGEIVDRDDEGKPTRVIGLVEDVTRKKQVEDELIRAKIQAEAASEAKAKFLASMSHEIRTPMNAVIGLVDLIRQTELSGDQAQMLQTIADSGQSLLTIINDILDFSKIEAGRLDLETIPMALTEVVEGASKTVAVNARAKNLRILSYIDPRLPQFVLGDQVRIRQILINLIGNAIKFTAKGNVFLVVEAVEQTEEQVLLNISIKDEGIGISEAAQAELFTAFSQAESSTTRKYGGTGLGLSISERLATMMGGRIEVQSELGKGSTFTLSLPLAVSEKKAVDYANDLAGIRVMLIVQDEFERESLTSYLNHWSAEVSSIRSLDSCLVDCLKAEKEGRPFDVVVMGPGLDRAKTFSMHKASREAGLKNLQFLALLFGKRSKARLYKDEIATLDVDSISRAEFLSAVAISAGRASPEVHYQEEVEAISSDKALMSIDEARAAGRLILVAEDNPTNRDVIGRQLKVLGYTFEMADDGALALAAWENDDFGMLLTDCHMPNMDGFELTAKIREHEVKSKPEERFPIVAITANALQGEAEICLAAGMDGYLSKPINLRDLARTLKQWLPEDDTDASAETATVGEHQGGRQLEESSKGSSVDISALKGLIGDDEEMLREVLQDFIEPSLDIIDEIKAGHSARSAERVKQAAHKLKSSARSIGANALAELCLVLETAGKDNDLERINVEVVKIDEAMGAVCKYIEAL